MICQKIMHKKFYKVAFHLQTWSLHCITLIAYLDWEKIMLKSDIKLKATF